MERKTRVLIADAGEDYRRLLTDLIEAEGDMEVAATAADGVEALSKITELKPDVVLLDLMLPKRDGLSVLEDLPNTGANPFVLVVSGFHNEHVIAECAERASAILSPSPVISRRSLAASARAWASGPSPPWSAPQACCPGPRSRPGEHCHRSHP